MFFSVWLKENEKYKREYFKSFCLVHFFKKEKDEEGFCSPPIIERFEGERRRLYIFKTFT